MDAASRIRYQWGVSDESVRFVIINVTPAALSARLRPTMERVGEIGESRTALAYPPHVTLRTGAIVPRGQIDSWLEGFREHAAGLEPVTMRTNGFAHTTYQSGGEARHFFGYTMEPTAELLHAHRRLLAYEPYRKSNQDSYWPHLSVAYHDVTDEGAARIEALLAAEPELLPRALEWRCTEAGLYHQVGERWVEWTTISLGS